jgi:hypothetical protein
LLRAELYPHNLTTFSLLFSTRTELNFASSWIASIGDSILTQLRDISLSEFPDVRFESTKATTYSQDDILACNQGRLTALLIATFAPLLAGIISVILDLMPSSLCPRLLMNISTIIRDNPYVNIPSGGSTLNDSERSRLLKHVIVQLGDVNISLWYRYLAVKELRRDCSTEDRMTKPAWATWEQGTWNIMRLEEVGATRIRIQWLVTTTNLPPSI